jgi:hypothetical protein
VDRRLGTPGTACAAAVAALPGGRRRRRSAEGASLGVDRAAQVTPQLLGASPWQTRVFRSAVFASMLSREVAAREAMDAVWAEAAGARRRRCTPTRSVTQPTGRRALGRAVCPPERPEPAIGLRGQQHVAPADAVDEPADGQRGASHGIRRAEAR